MGLNLNTYNPLVKLNQKNIGTIRSSNLGTEIVEYLAPDEVAVCNLVSIALHTSPQTSTRSLMLITTLFLSPTSVTIQLALTFKVLLMHSPFCDYLLSPDSACELNHQIFEIIYNGALKTLCELSERDSMYETYKGPPASQGELQYDL